ncbi:hypothetical protein PR002_g31526 [Phytophthora rubi]|uniref:Uncharacterized protein n=1 Tax=Phytophthora rubi TaxID=129364 RepID=A0A6A3GIT2_9STRA|nr:hypothetical protein PR002_g31526 [Phytophthora rubi]
MNQNQDHADNFSDLTPASTSIIRTPPLQTASTVDAVINFNVPGEVLMERISGRRVHPASGRS